MKKQKSNFYRTKDGEQIFYATNFQILPQEEYKNVVIFNYGLVCSNHHWSKQLDYFDELGYKILILDYRGHYQSTGKEQVDNITFDRITEDLFELIDFLHLKESYLIGHSMGVNISLEFCKRFPELIKKQIIISGTPVPVFNVMLGSNIMDIFIPFAKKLYKKHPKIVNAFWKGAGLNPLVKYIIHKGGFNIKQVPMDFIEIYLNRISQLGPEIFFQLINEMHRHDIMAHINRIATPTLVIGGDRDQVIPNYLQKIFHKNLPNSELYIIHQGSHVPQADFPELINERIHLFLTQDNVSVA